MPLTELENTVEPIFAMWRSQRNAPDEALGDFCHRVGVPTVEAFMESYTLGGYASMAPAFPPVETNAPTATVGVALDLLSKVEAEAKARGMSSQALLDAIVREALEG
jgi:sulfite reductase (ferredoxin)